jgi:SsrA-binding protein
MKVPNKYLCTGNKMNNTVKIKNKKASFEFFLLEKFVAGIVLTGTEIKSIRESKASIAEAYCLFIREELFIRNMHIAEYTYGTCNNHDPKRDRKLLMNKRELKKLSNRLKEQGITVVPISLFINEKGFAKIEISLAKGKKLYDKRETIKGKDMQREIDRSGK